MSETKAPDLRETVRLLRSGYCRTFYPDDEGAAPTAEEVFDLTDDQAVAFLASYTEEVVSTLDAELARLRTLEPGALLAIYRAKR